MLLGLLIFGFLGLIFGSFINAWVYRTNSGKSIARGRSRCPQCDVQLAWYDNIPLLSYAILHGKCRSCGKLISLQYPLVEIATALLFAGLYIYFHPYDLVSWSSLLIWLAATVCLVAAFVYDLRWMILPDRFMIPAIILGLIYVILLSTKVDQGQLWRLAGAGVFAGLYFLLWKFSSGKWIGDGDIRLAAAMGLLLSIPQLVVGAFAGYLVGSVVGVYLLIRGAKKRGDVIPLGPFLIIGLYVGLFWGQQIASWYLKLI